MIKPPSPSEEKSNIPLVRLGLILPFVQELDRRKINTDAVLMNNGLVRDTVHDPNVFVPVIVINRFLENAAEAAGDPYLAVAVGESFDLAQWPPFVDAVSNSTTVLDFLVRFIRAAKDEASSARHTLEIGSQHAFFRESRLTEQEIAPAQNDAFTATYLLNLLKRSTGPNWVGKQVMAKVCEPEVIPGGYLGADVVEGDRMGTFIRFPTPWLLNPLDRDSMFAWATLPENRLHLPVEFLDAFRRILVLHLDNAHLKVHQIAQLLGMSRQSLQRKLKASGTTLSAELIRLKKQRAGHQLTHSTKSIVEIATAVGFSNPTSFARAFKSWTGQSPRHYRKSHQIQ